MQGDLGEPQSPSGEVAAVSQSSPNGRQVTDQGNDWPVNDPHLDGIWTTYGDPQDFGGGAHAVPIDSSMALDEQGKVSFRRFRCLVEHAEHVHAVNPKIVFCFLGNRAMRRSQPVRLWQELEGPLDAGLSARIAGTINEDPPMR